MSNSKYDGFLSSGKELLRLFITIKLMASSNLYHDTYSAISKARSEGQVFELLKLLPESEIAELRNFEESRKQKIEPIKNHIEKTQKLPKIVPMEFGSNKQYCSVVKDYCDPINRKCNITQYRLQCSRRLR